MKIRNSIIHRIDPPSRQDTHCEKKRVDISNAERKAREPLTRHKIEACAAASSEKTHTLDGKKGGMKKKVRPLLILAATVYFFPAHSKKFFDEDVTRLRSRCVCVCVCIL